MHFFSSALRSEKKWFSDPIFFANKIKTEYVPLTRNYIRSVIQTGKKTSIQPSYCPARLFSFLWISVILRLQFAFNFSVRWFSYFLSPIEIYQWTILQVPHHCCWGFDSVCMQSMGDQIMIFLGVRNRIFFPSKDQKIALFSHNV